MYIRNFDPHPPITTKFEGLRKDGNYFFSHNCKIFLWFIIFTVIISSTIVLSYYGINFGIKRTYLWLTTLTAFFLITIFLVSPIQIMIFNLLDVVLFKGVPFVMKKKILLSNLFNTEDLSKKQKILKYRKYNANLYTPTPLYKLQSRLEEIKYNIELRNLLVDIFAYITFIATIFFMIYMNKAQMGFYSNEMVVELVVTGNYTHTISFLEVSTYELLLKYLNETFLPALLITPTGYSPLNNTNKMNRRRRSSNYSFQHFPSRVKDVRKRQILEDFENLRAGEKKVFEKGWTHNHNLKLLGKPRLRQVRVKAGSCKEVKVIQGRNIECEANLNLLNVETRTFSLFWETGPPKGLTEMQAAPWKYSSALNTVTMPLFRKFAVYPGGGYVLELARNIDDARILLEYLNAFQWIDVSTRAVFIEFAVYSVNTNLFNVVTLVAEKSASGYFVPSYEIQTNKFLFLEGEFEFMMSVMLILYVLLLFFFMLRESLRIYRTSFNLYLSRSDPVITMRTFGVLDLVIILLGVLAFIFLILKDVYVGKLMKKLEETNNNEFVSFVYAAYWDTWCVYAESLLLCLASFKLLRLLNFRVFLFRFQTTLNICCREFLGLVLELAVFIVAFTLLFYLILLNASEWFYDFKSSFSIMFARAVALDDKLNYLIFNSSSYLGPLFFVLFLFLVTFVFVSLFKAVICVYFHKIRNTPLTDKYDFCDYIKYFLTKSRQKDILHLRNFLPKRSLDKSESVMRLKGGGNKPAKEKTKKKKSKKKMKLKHFKTNPKKKKKPVNLRDLAKKTKKLPKTSEKIKQKTTVKQMLKEAMEKVGGVQKIMMKDFVTRKPFDLTKYTDLDALRNSTMRNLMGSYLTDDKDLKKILRNNALKGLFISFTTKSRKTDPWKGYFFVNENSDVGVYDSRIFSKMRKVVEDFGKEKRWFLEEEVNENICRWEKKLSVLNKKLSLLLKNQK